MELHSLTRNSMVHRPYKCIVKPHHIALQIAQKQICCMIKTMRVIPEIYATSYNSTVEFSFL